LNTSNKLQSVQEFDEEIENEEPQGTDFDQTTWKLLSATKFAYAQ